MRTIILAAVVSLAAAAAVAAPVPNSSQADRLASAATVIRELRSTPDRDVPEYLWSDARCIAVIPSVTKAAFGFGGEYGKGVVSCRLGDGWSAPAFIELAKGSFGLQLGAESVDLVLFVMNDRGMEHLLQDKVVLGGEASVAGGPVGRDARASTDAQMHAEILSYSRARGLFAGLDLSGGMLRADKDADREFYGETRSPRNLLTTTSMAMRMPASAHTFVSTLTETVAAESKR
jgi:lipid-binding SYLF domain-containing protein